MIQTERFEKIEVESVTALRNWLELNHRQAESVWLVTFKKSAPEKYISVEEVLDELLCFGWIDGIRRKLDETRTMQLISPRKVQHWTQTYKLRAERLIAEQRMHASGLASIQASIEAGQWNTMDGIDRLEIPADLMDALQANAAALAFFQRINPSSKRFVLRWLHLAKTEKTRKKRIAHIVEISARGEKLKGS